MGNDMDEARLLLLLAPMAKVNGEMRTPPCCCCCRCNGLDGGKRDDDVKPAAPVASDRHAIALTTVILFLLVDLWWQGRGDMLFVDSRWKEDLVAMKKQ